MDYFWNEILMNGKAFYYASGYFLILAVYKLSKKEIEYTYPTLAIILGGIGLWKAVPQMEKLRSGIGSFAVNVADLAGDKSTEQFVRDVQFFYYGGIVLLVAGGLLVMVNLIINAMPKVAEK